MRVYPVPSAGKGVILSCAIVVSVQTVHGVKFLAVILVRLQVGGGVPCLRRERSTEAASI